MTFGPQFVLEELDDDQPGGEAPRMVFQVLGQVRVHKLKDEGERGLGVDDVVEGDNVGVFQLL